MRLALNCSDDFGARDEFAHRASRWIVVWVTLYRNQSVVTPAGVIQLFDKGPGRQVEITRAHSGGSNDKKRILLMRNDIGKGGPGSRLVAELSKRANPQLARDGAAVGACDAEIKPIKRGDRVLRTSGADEHADMVQGLADIDDTSVLGLLGALLH